LHADISGNTWRKFRQHFLGNIQELIFSVFRQEELSESRGKRVDSLITSFAEASGISLPFTTFILHLTIPTMINLFLTYMILRIYFRKDLSTVEMKRTWSTAANSVGEKSVSLSIIQNTYLAKTSAVILLLTIAGFIISEFMHLLHIADIRLSVIALLGAAALYLINGGNRIDILKNVDYSVLVFFAAMFVVTSALWSSGVISTIMSYIPSPNPNNFVQSNTIISIMSILVKYSVMFRLLHYII